MVSELTAAVLQAAAVLTAVGVLWRWCGAPIRQLLKQMQALQSDVTDLMWDRLAQGHDSLMRRGWASDAEKERLCAIHRRYKASGRNHLAESYEKELLELPSEETNG